MNNKSRLAVALGFTNVMLAVGVGAERSPWCEAIQQACYDSAQQCSLDCFTELSTRRDGCEFNFCDQLCPEPDKSSQYYECMDAADSIYAWCDLDCYPYQYIGCLEIMSYYEMCTS